MILAGDDVDGKSPKSFPHVWKLADLDWTADGPMPAVPIVRDDVTQIIFTSGATAEPKGVVIRHRNVLANIVPVEREVMKYRKYARPFHPLRFSICCRSVTCSGNQWRAAFHRWSAAWSSSRAASTRTTSSA